MHLEPCLPLSSPLPVLLSSLLISLSAPLLSGTLLKEKGAVVEAEPLLQEAINARRLKLRVHTRAAPQVREGEREGERERRR